MGLEKINYFKKRSGLTNKQISEMTGISISSLDKITSGENTNPKFDTIRLICNALGCTANDLMDSPPSDMFSIDERQLVEKYRVLDSHGKIVVDFLLNQEYIRCTSDIERYKMTKDKTHLLVAGVGGSVDIEISDRESLDAEVEKLKKKHEKK